jgi:hypothetical protein
MGKNPLDAILAIGGDLLAPFTGGLSAIVGNTAAGADELAHGNPLGLLNLIPGVGEAAGLIGGGALPGLDALNPAAKFGEGLGEIAGGTLGGALGGTAGTTLGSTIGGAAGTAAADFGKDAAANAAIPALLSSLGLRPSASPVNPTSALATPKAGALGAGSGAGPGLGSGGLDVQGGTAPKIFPYVQPSATNGGLGSQPGQQQQARGI